MKAELKEKIIKLTDKLNMNRLKDVIATIHWYDIIENWTYVMYDWYCHINNVDLYYLVGIDDNWWTVIKSSWYSHKIDLLNDYPELTTP